VLLVSTDPASNVGQVFGVTIGNHITAIPACPAVGAGDRPAGRRPSLPRPHRRPGARRAARGRGQSIEEQLSGACTTEIAAFDEFTALLLDSPLTRDFDHIVFDTAPTGHTIRLLQLPGAWSGFLEAGKGDASCLGPLAGLEKQRTSYKAAVAGAGRPAAHPPGAGGPRSKLHLARSGAHPWRAGGHWPVAQHLVINGVLPEREGAHDPLAAAVVRREQAALADLPAALRDLPTRRDRAQGLQPGRTGRLAPAAV
jgi:arsenite-transporting ATPase